MEGSPIRAYSNAPHSPDRLYRSSLQSRWLDGQPDVRWQEHDGTLLFLDFSSFIRGAERAVRRRKMEAHQLSAVLNIVLPRPRSLDIVNTDAFGAYVRRIRAALNASGGVE